MTLQDTIPLMLSSNRSDNLKAEYYQVCIRIDTLKRMLDNIYKGAITYIPVQCLEYKYDNLLKYKQILKHNIKEEGIHFDNYVYILTKSECMACGIMLNLIQAAIGHDSQVAIIKEVTDEELLASPFNIHIEEAFPITIYVRDGIEVDRINGSVRKEVIMDKYNKWFIDFDN